MAAILWFILPLRDLRDCLIAADRIRATGDTGRRPTKVVYCHPWKPHVIAKMEP